LSSGYLAFPYLVTLRGLSICRNVLSVAMAVEAKQSITENDE